MLMPNMTGDLKIEDKFAWLPVKIDRKFIWLKTYRITYQWSEVYDGYDWIVHKRELINTDINSDINEGSLI